MQLAMLVAVAFFCGELLLDPGCPLGSLSSSLEGLRFAMESTIAFDPDFR